MKFIQPTALAKSYTCPWCQTISQQLWWKCGFDQKQHSFEVDHLNRISAGRCLHCEKSTLWVDKDMCYPNATSAPPANEEMPVDVLKIYKEASDVFAKSPRAASALLRLAIQILCKHLGEKGKHIDTDIAALVAKGLPLMIQQSLDTVRVIGNNAVHPGQIDTDDVKIVKTLFDLVNIIVEYMIAMPKKVSGIYGNLPAAAISSIEKRDS